MYFCSEPQTTLILRFSGRKAIKNRILNKCHSLTFLRQVKDLTPKPKLREEGKLRKRKGGFFSRQINNYKLGGEQKKTSPK